MKHLCWTYTALKSWLLKAPTGWVSRSLWVRNPTMPWPSAALSLFFITGLAAPTCRVLASTSLFLSNAHTTQNTVKEPAWLGFAYPPSQIMYRKHTEISISGLWEHGRLISFDVCVCVCVCECLSVFSIIWMEYLSLGLGHALAWSITFDLLPPPAQRLSFLGSSLWSGIPTLTVHFLQFLLYHFPSCISSSHFSWQCEFLLLASMSPALRGLIQP